MTGTWIDTESGSEYRREDGVVARIEWAFGGSRWSVEVRRGDRLVGQLIEWADIYTLRDMKVEAERMMGLA